MTMRLQSNRICIAARAITGTTGTSRTILDHARFLVETGKQVSLVCEEGDARKIEAAGAKFVRLPRLPLGSRGKRLLFSRLVDAYVRWSRQELVWGHGDQLNQDVLSLHNCVHLAHERVHGSPLPRSSGVGYMHTRILAERRFRRLIANSKLMAEDAVRRFGVDPDTIGIIYPGYDPSLFNLNQRSVNRQAVRAQLGIDQKTWLVGLVTSGDLKKRGVDEFLQGLARLDNKQRSGMQAVIIGKHADKGGLAARVRALGVEPLVSFLPASREVWKYYHALDLMVHPARIEEFGQVVQEAIVCGTPVVATAHVGACELLQGVAKGLIMADGDPTTIAAKLVQCRTSEEMLREQVDCARQMMLPNTHHANFTKTLHFLSGL